MVCKNEFSEHPIFVARGPTIHSESHGGSIDSVITIFVASA